MHCLTCPVMRFHYTALNAGFCVVRTLKNMWVQFTSTETVGSSRLCSEKLPRVMILDALWDPLA